LALAYLRRQKWQAEATAAAVVNLLGEAMNAGQDSGEKKPGDQAVSKPRVERVSAEEMLKMMGVDLPE
jgi:hypothetical protein